MAGAGQGFSFDQILDERFEIVIHLNLIGIIYYRILKSGCRYLGIIRGWVKELIFENDGD